MAETSLALHPSSVLARVGAPEERQYLIGVLAETLGIPAKDASRPDVMAILGMAVQRTSQYGWLSGLHMHCQKFETSESRNRRKQNPTLPAEYTYTLVDGEKAWKDSGSRWRILYGVNWTYNRKPMTREELSEHARLMGYTLALPGNAYGIWSRIILIGSDDPKDPENPMFSSGVFLGKRKVGNSWYDEELPTQVTSRDVAIRRADKRAMMQSPLTLLPVDDMTPAARVEKLTDHLRSEGRSHRDDKPHTSLPSRVLVEADGDVLWTTDVEPRAREDFPDTIEDDQTDEGQWTEKPQPQPMPTAAKVASDAPPAGSGGRCPECNAPEGKPHATSCPRRSAPPAGMGMEIDARPAVDARPGVNPVNSPVNSRVNPLDIYDTRTAARPEQIDTATSVSTPSHQIDARSDESVVRPRPDNDAARPDVDADGVIESEWDAYAMLLHAPDIKMSQQVSSLLMDSQVAHSTSEAAISVSQYNLFRVLIKSIFGGDRDDEHKMLLSALCGVAIDHDHRPGYKVGIALQWLKDPNKFRDEIATLFEIMSLCRAVRGEMET